MTIGEPTGEPWPYVWPLSEHCHWHEAHEPVPPGGAHMICFECGHVYPDRAALVQAYVDGAPGAPVNVPEHIAFCPLCMHDF
jgi:hypothetical protein